MWNEAEKYLLKDKYVSPLIKKHGHCKLKPRNEKYYFEDLIDAIVQQQLSMKAASLIFNRLKEAATNPKSGKSVIYQEIIDINHKWRADKTKIYILKPKDILNLSDEQLRTCGLSRAKTLYVKDLSQRVIDNKLKIFTLKNLKDDEIIKELTTVKGVGEWTAHMFLMFSLGRSDIFPSGDLGLRNAFEKSIKKGLDKKRMEIFARRWKPYRTIASWYIWKTLEK